PLSASAANASLPTNVLSPSNAHTTSSLRHDTIFARSPVRNPSVYASTTAFCSVTRSPPTVGPPRCHGLICCVHSPPVAITDDDLHRLGRCVELARTALDDGDEPFGSILVDVEVRTLFEDRNRVSDGDATQHPEFAIARWAAANLTPAERANAI